MRVFPFFRSVDGSFRGPAALEGCGCSKSSGQATAATTEKRPPEPSKTPGPQKLA